MTDLHSTTFNTENDTNNYDAAALAYDAAHDVADKVGLCVDHALAVLDLVRHAINGADLTGLAQGTLYGALASIRTELERIDALVTGAPA